GRGRVLGRSREAGPDFVRTGRRSRSAGCRGVQPCRDEAADQDQGGCPPRRQLAPGRRMMAQKKFEDLRSKTDDQLADQLVELKRAQFNLRFQAATNQLERPARVKEVRREIARLKTLQSERSRASAEA